MTFGVPHYLLLLIALIPLTVWVGRRSLSGLSAGRARLVLLLRLGVVTALILALAEVGWRGFSPRTDVVFLVDHSRSVPADQARSAREAVRGAAARLNPVFHSGRVVLFGRDTATETELRRSGTGLGEDYASLVDREGTNLDLGLRRALSSLDASARRRIVLFSDGNQTTGDWREAAARARAAGVPVDVVPLEFAHTPEVVVEKLVAPSEARLGEPSEVRVVLRATAKLSASLRLWCGGAVVRSRHLDLEPGLHVEALQLQLERPGFFRLEAVVEPDRPEDDRLLQNNTSHGFVHVRGRSRLLHVSSDPAAPSPLVDALRTAKLEIERIGPLDFPLQGGALQAYDAIVIDDVPARRFSTRQRRNVAAAVNGMGVGLVMVGGPDAFGAGDYADTPIEDALPVSCRPKGSQAILSTGLVLVLDRSGSMQGRKLELAKHATAMTAEALGRGDLLGVVAFSDHAEWIVPLGPAGRDMVRAVDGVSAGGGTDPAPGLRLAYRALSQASSNTRHVILLTDGQQVAPSCAALARQMTSRGITLSTVGIADGARSELLKRLAAIGRGRYYAVADARHLPRIFLKETRRVARSLIVERRFTPRLRRVTAPLGELRGFPPLKGFVLTEAKPRAEVPLAAPDGAPILAHWQYGLGRVLAFTSDAQPRWAPDWVAWPGFPAFWSQAARWVSRSVEEQRFKVRTVVEDQRGRILVDAVDADGRLVDGLEVEAQVHPPGADAKPGHLTLRPRSSGRYEGAFPLQGAGSHQVSVVCRDRSGKVLQTVTTGVVAPPAREHRDLHSDRPLLEQLATSTGGRVLSPHDLREGAVDPWDPHGLPDRVASVEGWPAALMVALGLFLLEVGVRRMAIDWGALFECVLPSASVLANASATAAPTTSRLKEHLSEQRAARAASTLPAPAEPTSSEPPPAQPEPGRAEPQPPAEGGYTRRLLEAKRRAQQPHDDPG